MVAAGRGGPFHAKGRTAGAAAFWAGMVERAALARKPRRCRLHGVLRPQRHGRCQSADRLADGKGKARLRPWQHELMASNSKQDALRAIVTLCQTKFQDGQIVGSPEDEPSREAAR